jgi:hypothetical protein
VLVGLMLANATCILLLEYGFVIGGDFRKCLLVAQMLVFILVCWLGPKETPVDEKNEKK